LDPQVNVDDIVDPLLREVNVLNVRLHLPEELLLDYELGNIEREQGEKDEPGRGFEVLDAQWHEFLIYGFSQCEVGPHLTVHGGGHTADIPLVIVLQELASMVVIFWNVIFIIFCLLVLFLIIDSISRFSNTLWIAALLTNLNALIIIALAGICVYRGLSAFLGLLLHLLPATATFLLHLADLALPYCVSQGNLIVAKLPIFEVDRTAALQV
jgi:hypothetical protein